MEREYDLFEQLPDGSPVWRGNVWGLQEVRLKLQEIAKSTTNEYFAIHLPTRQIVARMGPRSGVAKPVVFQIAYDDHLASARTEILRLHGFEVASVVGNEPAMTVLSPLQRYDLFIVGHAAAIERRIEMVDWLRSRYPGVPILALNPPTIKELPGADYNAVQNGPEAWLPLISNAVGARRES